MIHIKFISPNQKQVFFKTAILTCLLICLVIITSTLISKEEGKAIILKFNQQIQNLSSGNRNGTVSAEDNEISQSKRKQRLRSFLSPPELYNDINDESKKIEIFNTKSFAKFDKRLLPALWLHKINENIAIDYAEKTILPEHFTLPFNWDLLLDNSHKIQENELFEKVIKNKISCEDFKNLAPSNQPDNFDKFFCKNYDYENPNFINEYNLPFAILGKLNAYLSDISWRRLHGMMFTLTSFPIPENVVFLGAIDQDNENRALVIPLEKISNGDNNDLTKQNLDNNFLQSYYMNLSTIFIQDKLKESSTKNLTKDEILINGISVYQELNTLNNKLSNQGIQENKLFDLETSIPIYRPSKPVLAGQTIELKPKDKPVDVDPKIFEWYLPQVLDTLKQEISTATQYDDTQQLSVLEHWAELILDKNAEEPTHYGTPSVKGQSLDHYDWRFFNNYTFKDNNKVVHTAVLHRLARTWFRLCQQFDIPTWLNHGPLIGWYWNGMSLPYDYDLDLQMPIQSLHKVAKFLNNTLIYDFTNEPDYVNDELKIDNKAELGTAAYYIDINPTYFDRNGVRSDKNNIDARLIDTETGLYIDITAIADFLSETQYDISEQKKVIVKGDNKAYRMIIPSHIDQFFDEKGVFERDEPKSDNLRSELFEAIDKFIQTHSTTDSRQSDSPTTKLFQNYAHCKHFHTYNISELSPLIPVYFENTLAYLPSNWYTNILIEYGTSIPVTSKYYAFNKFVDDLKLWVDYVNCPIWDRESSNPKGKMTEHDVAQQCVEENIYIKEDYQRTIDYTTLHAKVRDYLKPKSIGSKGLLEFNYEKDVKPLLNKFSGFTLKPYTWNVENLY
ncbi:hypothetical protein PACTADRAFT_50920 [Pachysolen tannophilus NRRL Y-2460]|uniref:LicD/FKTN/FKRP nucleotidyltransferase domain-containing protein n=1 Tax=Pachysolen tannophilus NRRL Y-2460 TaxID=669874 RepID=A0A1E4TTT7_PACTA|nr:hypothetical protein PACTADRAFT_50920 [Pachysolen tannophilus NRRL Y-2460]